MHAIEKTSAIQERLGNCDINLSIADVNTLRRAEMVLHRWAELECGDGNNYQSWAIERDEVTSKPFMCVYPHTGKMRKFPTPDREAGALRRITEVCKRNNLHFYHQTDPRGCQLYISLEPIAANDYATNGIVIAA